MTPPDTDADEAAAAWDARLRGAATTERDYQAFQAWLQADAANQRAYDSLQTVLRALRSHADRPELSALRDEARGMAAASKRRRMTAVFAVAATVTGIGLLGALPSTERGAVLLAELQGDQVYSTRLHEQTRVTLADGSLVTLDSGTRMVVRLGEKRRNITLTGGRALFRVAKDSERPFVVKAGDRTITALGTVFDVRMSPHELRVTLAEGSVAVRPVGGGAPYHVLKPRQQLVALATAAAPVLRTVDIENTLAWADRQFFFEDEPLASAIDEINRNSDLQIVVEPALADLRINGMFRVSDQAAFIAALEMALPVDVQTDSQGRLIVARRTNSRAAPGAGKRPRAI